MDNFQDNGVTGAIVKWYDRYSRLFSLTFSSLNSAREFYISKCKSDDCPIYAKLTALTVQGPIVLREYRPS